MEVKKCREKESYKCVYVTKYNYNDFIKLAYHDCALKILEENDEYVRIKIFNHNAIHFIYFEAWYVNDWENEWNFWTKDDFENDYEIIED